MSEPIRKNEEIYDVGVWKETIPNYSCKFAPCNYSTIDPAFAWEHYWAKHAPPPPPPRPPAAKTFDRFGNEITAMPAITTAAPPAPMVTSEENE